MLLKVQILKLENSVIAPGRLRGYKFMYNIAMEKIQPLLDKIYGLGEQSNQIDKVSFEPFIKSLVNGDDFMGSLVILANLAGGKKGILVYILTNVKLIKVTISGAEIYSATAYLNQIIGVEKSFKEENKEKRAQISVEFPQGRFGLGYPADDAETDSFFQAVDQAVRKLKVE